MKNAVYTLCLFLTTTIVSAQEKMTLEKILQRIDSSSPVKKMLEAQVRASDEAAKGARSWMPTDFSTGLWMTPYNVKMWQKASDGTTGMGQYMLSAQQMFPNRRKQDAEAAYLEGMSAVDKERVRYELNELWAEAKKSYYDWIVIKKKISLNDESISLLNLMLKDAEIRYKNGLDKLNAYYRAKAELGRLQNTKLTLQNEAGLKRIKLNTLMNRNNSQQFDIDTVYNIKAYLSNIQDTFSLSNRSEIKIMDQQIQLTALQQASERTKTKPEFGLRVDHMFGFGGLPWQYSVMGMARIPIGKANRLSKANVESLRWKSEALTQQRQLLLNNATGAAAELVNQLEYKKKQVKLFEENIIPALRKNYQVIQLGYQQNTEQLFSLLEAWDTLLKTQLEYLDQLQQLLNLQAELERIAELP